MRRKGYLVKSNSYKGQSVKVTLPGQVDKSDAEKEKAEEKKRMVAARKHRRLVQSMIESGEPLIVSCFLKETKNNVIMRNLMGVDGYDRMSYEKVSTETSMPITFLMNQMDNILDSIPAKKAPKKSTSAKRKIDVAQGTVVKDIPELMQSWCDSNSTDPSLVNVKYWSFKENFTCPHCYEKLLMKPMQAVRHLEKCKGRA